MSLLKYPRTRHIEGSRLQLNDKSDDLPIADLKGKQLVIEEKVDGANCGVSFNKAGELLLQSRGHYLNGGFRERHFNLLKNWANTHAKSFLEVLSDRYVMYGEWMYAKHTVFYDQLPHYFLEFDVYDRELNLFLSTEARHNLLLGLPIMPVPILYEGEITSRKQVEALVKPSLYKSSDWRKSLSITIDQTGNKTEFVEKQTEDSDLAEGLYLKHEKEQIVQNRFKFVRGDFLQAIQSSEGHWHDRPILPNKLMDGLDIFAPRLGITGAYDAKT